MGMSQLDLRRRDQRFRRRIQRRAVPGGSAEILGTLFQGLTFSSQERGTRCVCDQASCFDHLDGLGALSGRT